MSKELKHRNEGGIPTAFYSAPKNDHTGMVLIAGIVGIVVVSVVAVAFMVFAIVFSVCVAMCFLSASSMHKSGGWRK